MEYAWPEPSLQNSIEERESMTKKFDLVVIGTGTAASTVASQCRKAGWQVAIIDSRPFGGTCPLRGCDPKKSPDAASWAAIEPDRRKGNAFEARTVRSVGV